jgi:succinate dehydrogenase / fumarate reductase cytochrome b subunit
LSQQSTSSPTLLNILRWFDPRSRQIGTFAFIVNRISAIGLTVYLFLHLVVLGNLARGPEAYAGLLNLVKNPVFIFGEYLVVAAGLLHGFNGLRIALTSFNIGVRHQKTIFYGLMVVAVAGCILFAVKMFGGE